MWLQIIIALLLVVVAVFISDPKKPHGIPPGLWGRPFIGVLPSRTVTISDQVKELRKKYGDIISWRMGNRLFIFLCNNNLIKSAFAKLETAYRPDFYSLDSFTEFTNSGVANGNGRNWINNRRFALQHLKDLGMGRSFLGEAIEKEARFLVDDFKKYVGRPVSLPWSVNVAVMNVIWQMTASVRYDVNDEKLNSLHVLLNESLEALDGSVTWLDLFPWLTRLLPFSLRTWLGMNRIYDIMKEIRISQFDVEIKKHVKNFDPNNPKDLIDAYLLEMEKQKDDPTSTFSLKDLCHGAIDYFGDGSVTISMTMKWAILFLAKYPEVQERAQKEIDSVVPRDEQPTLEHRERLPYTEAFINEVLRLSSVAPMGVAHMNYEEIELGGYRIPKNSIIHANLEGCHKDPAYWERPNDFYPEHFLDEDGKFVMKKEGFFPFATGRRRCIGEALARMELYLFLSALIQNVSFSVPNGEELSLEKSGIERVMSHPADSKIIITERM